MDAGFLDEDVTFWMGWAVLNGRVATLRMENAAQGGYDPLLAGSWLR